MTDARFLEESLAVLRRTPEVIDSLLRDLPDAWTSATEGPGTWSPYDVVGHLLHCEQADWFPRLRIILEHGENKPFEPLDREAQFKQPQVPLAERLDAFRAARANNLKALEALQLSSPQLEKTGTHPSLGRVTARQLIATWTAHDLAHILQISRVMARRYKQDTGPWASHLSVMRE